MIFPFKLNSSVLITCIFFFTEEREVTGTKIDIKTMPSITLLTSLPSSSKNVKLPTVPVPLDQLKHQVELI